jgi:hypothetical protein
MKNTQRKLPGIGFRILSFIPALNWISLLYIGLVNSSILNVIFAVAYAVITFTVISLSPLMWIVGIVHYAVAYRNLKKQIVGEMGESTTQTRTNPIHKNTSVANGFSDIVVSGKQEDKQSIPVKPSYASKDVRVSVSPKSTSVANRLSDIVVSGKQEEKQSIPVRSSYASECVKVSVSVHNPYTKFFTEMERNASRGGKSAAFVPFMSYWPTYDSMNKAQQEWYFYWRSQIRQGNYIDTDLSYIFMLVYELLSGIGWQDPHEGYQKLMQLWAAYRKKFPSLDSYLTRWTFDFTQQYNLEYRLSDVDENPRLAPSVMADILISRRVEDVPLKLNFSLIDALSDYSLVKSKFYKDGNQDLMHEAIPRVIALADAALRKNKQKGILDIYGPSSIKKQEYYAFSSAVCPQANKKTYVTVKDYSTYPELRAYIKELVRYSENTLRELRGYKGRLRGVTIDEETAKLIENFLKKEYGKQATQAKEPSKPKAIIDPEKIKIITKESYDTSKALDTTSLDTTIPENKELYTNVQEITAIYTAISPSARSLLDRLDKSSWECSAAQGDEPLIAEINRLAEHYLGCILLVSEASKIIAEDDYRDELEYIYQNQPATSSEGKSSKLFDSLVLTPEMKDFVDALLPVQQKVLYVLITNENPQSDLETIAEEALTMPQPLLDEINELARQLIGDIIIENADQKPHVFDEYIDLLKQSVA